MNRVRRLLRRIVTSLAAFTVMLHSAPADAQPDYRITMAPGTEVRFSTRERPGDFVVGRADRVAGDTLVMATPTRRVLLPDLAALEVRGGRDRPRGAVIGAAALGLVTGIAGGVDYAQHNISAGDFIGTWLGNVAIGAGVGYLLAPTGWLRLPLPSRR